MEAVILFTPSPRRVTAIGPSEPLDTVEFINFRGLQLTLALVGFEGASDPVIQIAMETSMSFKGDYSPLGRFLPLVAAGESCNQCFDGVLRYVRWRVVQLEGASAATFTLEGKALP